MQVDVTPPGRERPPRAPRSATKRGRKRLGWARLQSHCGLPVVAHSDIAVTTVWVRRVTALVIQRLHTRRARSARSQWSCGSWLGRSRAPRIQPTCIHRAASWTSHSLAIGATSVCDAALKSSREHTNTRSKRIMALGAFCLVSATAPAIGRRSWPDVPPLPPLN